MTFSGHHFKWSLAGGRLRRRQRRAVPNARGSGSILRRKTEGVQNAHDRVYLYASAANTLVNKLQTSRLLEGKYADVDGAVRTCIDLHSLLNLSSSVSRILLETTLIRLLALV